VAAVAQINSSKRRRLPAPAPSRRSCPLDRARPSEVVWGQVAPLFEAARYLADTRFVYFVGEPDGPVKIGLARDPVMRCRDMQIGNPRRLRVEYVLLGDQPTERSLHLYWREYAVVAPTGTATAPRTEWFLPDVREHLYPVVRAAAEYQINRLAVGGDVPAEDMLAAVKHAHLEANVPVRLLDEVRLLRRSAGFA
jgi:hypothetical protein